LIQVLKDENSDVRWNAVDALKEHKILKQWIHFCRRSRTKVRMSDKRLKKLSKNWEGKKAMHKARHLCPKGLQ
jgi:hypothetical protein